MLTPKSVQTIKEITPLVAANAETITRRFYTLMFEGTPEVKAFFNPTHQQAGTQQKALAGAICAYFTHIDNPGVLMPAIELMAQKHCSMGVQAEHYPIVGNYLLAAIKDVMGEAATDDILEAVTEAYQFLADVMISREKSVYSEQISATGGWNGWREFIVERKQAENELITSFYLSPADNGVLPLFQPGQYISLKIDHPTPETAPRNYSLSDQPGVGYFRVSVKRESEPSSNTPAGVVSNFLHDSVNVGDTVKVGPPCGEFTLDPTNASHQPTVLIAGGIGITPLLAMAKSLIHVEPNAPLYILQAARNSNVHAFRNEIKELAANATQLKTHFIYDSPAANDVESKCCDSVGFITSELLANWAPIANGRFYFCGPPPFMDNVHICLKQLSVDESRMSYEFFGPKQTLVEAVA